LALFISAIGIMGVIIFHWKIQNIIQWCGIFEVENQIKTISVDDYSVSIRIPAFVWTDFKEMHKNWTEDEPLIVKFERMLQTDIETQLQK
jgi:hypothetical protein